MDDVIIILLLVVDIHQKIRICSLLQISRFMQFHFLDGAAFKAGLDAGDIITHVNGDQITHPGALEMAIFMTAPKQMMTLKTLRGDQAATVSLMVSGP